MGSKSSASVALFLAFNILFFTLVSANCSCENPPSPKPKSPPSPKPTSPPSTPKTPPTPKPKSPPTTPKTPPSSPKPTPPSAPTPTTPSTRTCPRNALKLGVCGNLLGGLAGVVIGNPSKAPCCSLLQGLADLDAAICLCTAIRANILGINLNVPISLTLLLNTCGYKLPSGYKCA